MTWMLTATGSTVDLRFITAPGSIDLLDIAHHLSQLNRFTGACSRPYSVAEHSLLVCHLVEQQGVRTPAVLLAALMHDAHEAYTADLSSPMKQVLGMGWQLAERKAQIEVLRHFNLLQAYMTAHDVITAADLTALSTERAALMPAAGPEWPVSRLYPPADWDFAFYEDQTWKDWRQAFIERYIELNELRRAQAEAAEVQP
jgi:hypothetical protein